MAVDGGLGVIRLVEVASGKEIGRLEAPESTRLWVQCFTADAGKLICVALDTQQLYLFDLRALRAGLEEMGLDWHAPPIPPPAPAAPLRFEVPGADQLQLLLALPFVPDEWRQRFRQEFPAYMKSS